MGNVNSLPNKSEELEALVKNQRAYRECSLMCFTETWLNNNIPDSCVELPDFSMTDNPPSSFYLTPSPPCISLIHH
eukprot:superscaffoldBa00004262_g18555